MGGWGAEMGRWGDGEIRRGVRSRRLVRLVAPVSPSPRPVPHPRLSRTLRELASSTSCRERCAEQPPALLVRGVAEFNARQFFECHETLEELWRAEEHPVRYLYQGLLHVGVGYYHLQRGNHHGAVTKLGSGVELLEFFAPCCQGVDLEALIAAARLGRQCLLELGPGNISRFDSALIPRIELSCAAGACAIHR